MAAAGGVASVIMARLRQAKRAAKDRPDRGGRVGASGDGVATGANTSATSGDEACHALKLRDATVSRNTAGTRRRPTAFGDV